MLVRLITILHNTVAQMKDKHKVLISSRSFGKIDSNAIELLKNNGLEPILNPYGKKLNEDEILDLMNESVGIIAGTENITKKIINNNSNLKVISRYGIGLDNVDIKTAQEKGILVYNTPESPSIAVSELTLSLILTLLKKIVIVNKCIKNNQWKPEIGNLLTGKTVGIIGLGRIGKNLVKLLEPFKVKILTYDINPDDDFILKNNITLVSLEELLSKSDIVSLHLPLNEQTKYLIDEKELSLMKKNTILINTARGGLVNEKLLYNFLKTKKISGAAIDVFENEPDAGKLKELDNVVLTPHIATFTIETRRNMEIEAVENLINGLKKVRVL